jgi:hypothetical protein
MSTATVNLTDMIACLDVLINDVAALPLPTQSDGISIMQTLLRSARANVAAIETDGTAKVVLSAMVLGKAIMLANESGMRSRNKDVKATMRDIAQYGTEATAMLVELVS